MGQHDPLAAFVGALVPGLPDAGAAGVNRAGAAAALAGSGDRGTSGSYSGADTCGWDERIGGGDERIGGMANWTTPFWAAVAPGQCTPQVAMT